MFASGATVILALLCLLLAQVNGTSGIGQIGAMGVEISMLSMLTLLPAGLVVGGRRAFWPLMPRFGSEGTDETHGAWRRVGERVAATPRYVWITGAAARARLFGPDELLDWPNQHGRTSAAGCSPSKVSG